MSTRERLYTMINDLTEQQMQEVINYIDSRKKKGKTAASVMGILSDYANPDLIPLEEKAWERTVKNHETKTPR